MPETFLIGGYFNKKFINRNYIFGSFLKERLQGPQECDWLRDKSYIFFYLRAPPRSPLTLRIALPITGQRGQLCEMFAYPTTEQPCSKIPVGKLHWGLISHLHYFLSLGIYQKFTNSLLKRCVFFMKKLHHIVFMIY